MQEKSRSKIILVTGGGGFIGSGFLNFALNKENNKKTKRKFYSKKLNCTIIAPSHKRLDITKPKQVEKIFTDYKPHFVINFAAHRDANSAELQRGDKNSSAWRTNVEGVKNVLKFSKKHRSFVIHISTDMVFSGNVKKPGPYRESSRTESNPNNLSWYGWTKAEGERVLKDQKNTAIIRIGNVTQSVYNPRLDYIGKILYLLDRESLYPLFHNQYLTLTYVYSLYEVIESLIQSKKTGIFHVASNNLFTPYQLAKYLLKHTKKKNQKIRRVTIEKYLKKAPNRYPKFGGLLSKKTQKELKVLFGDWEEIVDGYAEKLGRVKKCYLTRE